MAVLRSRVGAPFTAARSSRTVRVVRAAAEAPAQAAPKERKLGPLQRGGTLNGDQAAGKDAGAAARAALEGQKVGTYLQIVDGRFVDDRWINGRWDLSQFAGKDGNTDWDKVIDAEVARRKMLEDCPIPSVSEDPVLFDTAEIPWWAWVRRFHLPEAEKLNGRAAMLGYVLALFVDKLSGASLLEQQGSFLGLVALHITVFGVLFVRQLSDIDNFKTLVDEATFYDKQWNATWSIIKRPGEETPQQ